MSKAEEKFIEELSKENEIILGFQEYERKIADLEAKLKESEKDKQFYFFENREKGLKIRELKQQLEDIEESYNRTMAYLNIIRSEFLNLPKKIVEEIRKDMSESIIEKQIKWKDNIQIGFICNVINESLDTILKKY